MAMNLGGVPYFQTDPYVMLCLVRTLKYVAIVSDASEDLGNLTFVSRMDWF